MTAHHRIWNAGLHKGFFNQPGLRIGPVENGKITVRIPMRLALLFNLFDHVVGFIVLTLGPVIRNFVPLTILGPQLFIFPVNVVGNHLVSRIQNRLRRAIILFQNNRLGRWVILFKVQDVIHVGPPPTIDTLIGIPHDTQIFVLRRQLVD